MRRFEDVKGDRVHFLDERFYDVGDGQFYPSVTTILDMYPKGPQFLQWIKDVGNSAKMIAERAAESGSKVHGACEKLIAGNELVWDDREYSFEEWSGVLRFVEFCERFSPEFEASEVTIVSHKYRYAGTLDIICKIDGARWLLDIKFGNAIYDTYYMQLAAYRKAWEEINPGYEIDRTGVIHLKASTRTDGKGKTMQGKGWQILEPKDSYDRMFGLFKNVLDIYYYENPDPKPKNLVLPSKIKL